MNNKSSWGGVRPGAGRKEGTICKKTQDKKEAERLFTERILKNVDRLFESQMSLAQGLSYLYRIDEVKEGKVTKKKTELVTDPEEIRQYFDGEVESDSYYYITTKDPDNRSIDSMLDRTFGKAVQKLEVEGKPQMMIIMDLKVSNPKFHELTAHSGLKESSEPEEGEIIPIERGNK